ASDALQHVDRKQRRIFIETRRDGDHSAVLSVVDSGIGLTNEDMGKLFDPFFTTKPDGMGIGLSVSHSIIDGHRGRLWAIQNEGRGATFSFSIPCIVPPETLPSTDPDHDHDRTMAS